MLSVLPPHIVTDGGIFTFLPRIVLTHENVNNTSVCDGHHIGTDGRSRCLIIAKGYKG